MAGAGFRRMRASPPQRRPWDERRRAGSDRSGLFAGAFDWRCTPLRKSAPPVRRARHAAGAAPLDHRRTEAAQPVPRRSIIAARKPHTSGASRIPHAMCVAIAMMPTCGFTPRLVGTTLPSAT